MRILKSAAMIAAVVAGALGLSLGTVSASPLAGATPAIAKSDNGLVNKVWHWGGPHRGMGPGYGPRHGWERPRYVVRHGYRPYRPIYRPYREVVVRRVYRPYRPVYNVYRPYPRVVCRTRVRWVPTRWGHVRRPVQICTRRW